MPTDAAELEPNPLEGEAPEQNPEDEWGGDGFPELPEEKQLVLKNLVKKALQREKYSRRTEVIDARQQRFYSRSIQYIFWDWNQMTFAPMNAGGAGNAADQERYYEVYDIYSAFLRTLVAALSQNPVSSHMEPRSPKRTVDIAASEAAENYRSRVEQINDMKRLQVDLARLFCTDGRVVSYAHSVPPDPKYGMDAENEPMGAEIIELYGILESKVPITQNCIEKWPYCVLSTELEIEFAKDKYPQAVDKDGESKIKGSSTSSGESAYERMARLGVLQGTKMITATGETWEHVVTEHIAFLRPSFYLAAPKEERDWLKETFPNGIRIGVCGDAYCGAWKERMDDHISVQHSKPGDGQHRTSLLKAFIVIQDAFSDLCNLQKEIFEYCIPEKWMDKETYDLVSQQEHRSEPGNSNPVVLSGASDDSVQRHIWVEPNIEVPASMVNAMNNLSGELAQLITAALPSLMGTGDQHNETGKGIAMMREQALGQMGIAWGASQKLLSTAIMQCVKEAGRTKQNDKVSVAIPGGNGSPSSVREVEMAELAAGDFYDEVDASFPDTRAMRRAVFNSLLQMAGNSPVLQQMLALPENQELFKEMVDDDLEVPGSDARIQQLREIEELLKSSPIPPTQQQMMAAVQPMAQAAAQQIQQGAPPPPPPDEQALIKSLSQPTVPIDPDWDQHQFHVQVITDWLASQECQQEKERGNQAGIENVKLHGALHKKALAAAQQPPQTKPPSESINYADLPPDGKLQMAAHGGITLNPEGVAMMEAQKSAAAMKPPQGGVNA